MGGLGKFLGSLWETSVYIASGEWLLTRSGSNGGDVILARSLLVAVELSVVALGLRNLIDPSLNGIPSWKALFSQVVELAPWFAAATGAVYAALYARFSAQWSYLATLYNQIKQAELEMAYSSPNHSVGLERLAEWKAGYIEDAQGLHLHDKENVAAVVHHWGKEPAVELAFVQATAGGQARWNALQRDAAHSYARAGRRYP